VLPWHSSPWPLGCGYLLFGPTKEIPFLLFLPAVIVAAVVFDRGSGLVATAVSAILSLYFFIGDGASASNILRLVIFCVVGTFIAVMTEALHAAYVEAEEDHREIASAHSHALASEERAGMLLRELRHRVRNDLQRIVAMLRLQPKKDAEAITCFTPS
jgi:two-component system, sensor histidine kinase PdtaS